MNANPLLRAISVHWQTGALEGKEVKESQKLLGDLKGIFLDEAARASADADTVVYRVKWFQPAEPGNEGGLFWGVTTIEPGQVGGEFFMTHGHFHANPTRAEYYATAQGEGRLLLMDRDRKTWAEAMSPGSLHYIDGRYAHRVVNTGNEPLIFWACWPSDAGYDYGTIAKEGFGARVLEENDTVRVIPQSDIHK